MGPYKKITVMQRFSENTIQDTLVTMKNLVKKYKDSNILVFPELFVGGGGIDAKPRARQLSIQKAYKEYGVGKFLRGIAKKYKTEIIYGSMSQAFNNLFNSAIFISNGNLRRYRKVHVHWTERFERGKDFKVFDSRCGKIGILICFDAAFPEAARILALKGAKIIFVISNVPKEFGHEYMKIRLKAIALNNQVFVVYCNKPYPYFSGHSAIIGPKGNVIFEAGTKEAVFTKKIDLREVGKWRKEEKIYQYRTPGLYRGIIKNAEI